MDGYITDPLNYHFFNFGIIILILIAIVGCFIAFRLWLDSAPEKKKPDYRQSPKYYYYSKDNILTRTIVYRKQFDDQLDDCGVF